jgi:hypothetical protein
VRIGSEWMYPVSSGEVPVAGCCEFCDEPAGSGATELLSICGSHMQAGL